MLRVFIALLTGVTCQSVAAADLFYFEFYSVNYELYRCARALLYAACGYATTILAYQELKMERNFQACIISLLCFCMIITSWFDLTMAYRPLYEILNYYRTEHTYSWAVIYRAIELLTVLIVLIYVAADFVGRVASGGDRIKNDTFNRRYYSEGQ